MFIGGKSDWGVYQTPGAAESMQKSACTRMLGFHLVNGAGHWMQQEQAGEGERAAVEFPARRICECERQALIIYLATTNCEQRG
jgi:hypothetical protein